MDWGGALPVSLLLLAVLLLWGGRQGLAQCDLSCWPVVTACAKLACMGWYCLEALGWPTADFVLHPIPYPPKAHCTDVTLLVRKASRRHCMLAYTSQVGCGTVYGCRVSRSVVWSC
jgi:hypothetical protein